MADVADAPSISPAWLALREGADAAARSVDLVRRVHRSLAGSSQPQVHDLGCGTGSMRRWLDPLLPAPGRWVLYDRDAAILGLARTEATTCLVRDVGSLTAADLAGADLVTAGALLDLLTAAEVDAVAAACAGAGVPALLTLSVTGRVELDPADPFDEVVRSAFNAHQARTQGGRRLLGPQAVEVAVAAFERLGAEVSVRPTPWRLGPSERELLDAWFAGWVDAAVEQEPQLSGPAARFALRRREAIRAGGLRAVVHHTDVLACWP